MSIINCPECSKQVSNIALACPHCGFPFKQDSEIIKKPSATSLESNNKKKVSILFGTGILFIPYIFSWFTLKKEYSNKVRIISFSWLVLFAVTIGDPFFNPLIGGKIGSTAVSSKDFWEVTSTADDSAKEKKKASITNQKRIVGYFSNTATQDSPLGVDFNINKYYSLEIMLYEYNRNLPVKSPIEKKYSIFFQIDNKNYIHIGKLFGSYIEFEGEAHGDIMKALKSDKEIIFIITDYQRITDEYAFIIPANTGINKLIQKL